MLFSPVFLGRALGTGLIISEDNSVLPVSPAVVSSWLCIVSCHLTLRPVSDIWGQEFIFIKHIIFRVGFPATLIFFFDFIFCKCLADRFCNNAYNIRVWQHPIINPLNTELNPVCHLLALLGAHHIFHVSKIRVKVGIVICFIWTKDSEFLRLLHVMYGVAV